MESILGYALGDVSPELLQDITVTLPDVYLPGWSAREAGTTTEGLLARAEHETTCPWTTLLVTPWLTGAASLESMLVTLKLRWPALRIAVLFGAHASEYQPLITTLSAYQIWNCLIADEFQYRDLIHLVTDDWTWEDVQSFLALPAGLTAPPQATMPSRVLIQRSEPIESLPAVSVAVVSAQGRSGKTGFIANAIWSTARWGSVAMDFDVEKPALPLYFRAANNPYPVHLQQLLTGLTPTSAKDTDGNRLDRLSPQDKQEIREYLHQAIEVTPGARLVPGPMRRHTMVPHLPPGLVTECLRQAKLMARVVWVDVPSTPADPIWEEAVRSVDRLVILTTPEPLAVLETLVLFERLDRLRVPRSVIHLVVNRAGRGGLNPQEIAEVHLNHPLLATIPDQPKLWQAAWQVHRPMADTHKRIWEPIATAFRPLDAPDAPPPAGRPARIAARRVRHQTKASST